MWSWWWGIFNGYTQKGVKKNELKQRLDQVFVDCGVEVWDSSLYWEE